MNERVIEIYDNQLKAIIAIVHTDWYKEIKKYWQREVESIKWNYPIVKSEDLYKLQEKDKIASSFLTFLTNLESTNEIHNKVK
jgi:hypothetical protein